MVFAMAITRKNSFELLLSDDEARLLELLAQREGLDPAEYLRALIRMAPSTSPTFGHTTAAALTVRALIGAGLDLQNFQKVVEARVRLMELAESAAEEPKKAGSR
jgi:hypothetical protein